MNWREVKAHREKRRKEKRAFEKKKEAHNTTPNTPTLCANSQDGLAPKKTH
jgi:hypothetical protein